MFEGGIGNRLPAAELLKSSHKENCLKWQVFRTLQGYCTLYHCLSSSEAPSRLAIELNSMFKKVLVEKAQCV